jgi:hypothetical protein
LLNASGRLADCGYNDRYTSIRDFENEGSSGHVVEKAGVGFQVPGVWDIGEARGAQREALLGREPVK